MDNPKFSVCCKKISMDGQILQNTDYGIGYTIVWENQYPIKQENRSGATPIDIINLAIQQLSFLDKSKNYNEKHFKASQKLIQALNILKDN